jgi:hypothetical protein
MGDMGGGFVGSGRIMGVTPAGDAPLVAAGAVEGIHLGTTATSVRRMLDGTQPHWPVPRLVTSVLARRLSREVSLTECGFAQASVVTSEQVDGLSCAGTLVGTVRTVASLSGQDLNRRRFLMGSAFAVTGFAQPALFALTLPAEADVARQHGRRVGAADIEVLSEQLTHLRRLDHRYGAGRVREQVVAVVNRAANLTLHGSYSDATGRALLEAVAHGTWLAGLMASDLGRGMPWPSATTPSPSTSRYPRGRGPMRRTCCPT